MRPPGVPAPGEWGPAPAAPADLAAALRVLVAAHEPEIRRLLAERAGEK